MLTIEDDSDKVEKTVSTDDNNKDSSDIQQSTNLFSDIKEKSDTEQDSNTVQDLSNNITKKEDLDLETNKEQDIDKNKIEPNIDIDNSTPKNLEKANTDISNNEITIDLEPLEKRQELHEIDIKFDEAKDSISLKNPNEVYIEIYKRSQKKSKTS